MADLSAQLRSVVTRLNELDLAGVQRDALAAAAERLRADVQRSLSAPPGSEHDTPWRKTGALEGSIETTTEDAEAVVGSVDLVAVDQELGTRTVPPRPFLAPAAARMAGDIADAIGDAAGRALREAVSGVMR